VSGHIDGVGVIKSTRVEGNATWVRVGVSTEILKYMIHKGSVTIDGISLTIARLDNQGFEVSLIPHTSNETTLLDKKSGDIVNIECDLISKYVERLMGFKKNDITLDLLKENGFM
jgi:riboflavin synthase